MSLDDTLAAWAAVVRLPAAAATDICQRIVMTPVAARPAPTSTITTSTGWTGLDPAWWRQFSADFSARMMRSTRPVHYAA
jgi:hypothetical protein